MQKNIQDTIALHFKKVTVRRIFSNEPARKTRKHFSNFGDTPFHPPTLFRDFGGYFCAPRLYLIFIIIDIILYFFKIVNTFLYFLKNWRKKDFQSALSLRTMEKKMEERMMIWFKAAEGRTAKS